ncbi:MAG: hypothetical protein U1E33_07180 [Rhodospirillales bacterium]
MPNQLSSGRAFSARVAAMTDEIERLEIAVVTCMEHAESLRQRITRLETSVAEAVEAAVPCAAASSDAGDRPAESPDRRGQPAPAPAPPPAVGRQLAAVRVPIRLRRPRDADRIVSTMLYAASAVLVGTLLSLAW